MPSPRICFLIASISPNHEQLVRLLSYSSLRLLWIRYASVFIIHPKEYICADLYVRAHKNLQASQA